MYPLPLVYEEPDEDTLPATLLLDVAVPDVYAVPDDEDVDEEYYGRVVVLSLT